MTTMKKLFALMLAVLMLLSVCAVAGAEETKYTITINNEKVGHTYEAYQIFAGDLVVDETTEDTTLSNIVWGDGVNTSADGFEKAVREAVNLPAETEFTAANVAEALTDDNVEDFAAVMNDYLATAAGTFANENKAYSISGLDAGYYLVKDMDDSLNGKEDSYTSLIMKVLKDIEVEPKSDVPTMTKKVKDINDTNEVDAGDWQDSADWDIDDKVPFCLEGKVASYYDDYPVYKYTFHDKLSDGLTFDAASVAVKVDGTKIETGYEVVTTGLTDGCTFEIVFDDLKGITVVKANSMITVEYTATLNDDAIIGAAGNPNEARLEFSNNPNDETGSETGVTPWDKVIVFTYKVVVDKVDQDQEPLAGAEFKLEKKTGTNAEGEGIWTLVKDYTTEEDGTTEGDTTADGGDAGDATTEPLTQFVFKGLDDGTYRLTETKTPAGYNTIEPITFEIKATHDLENDNPALTELTGEADTGEITLAREENNDDALETTIINKSGATLPETGGIGTTIFYVAGGVLVLLAVVLLVTKRRVGENN